MESPFFPIGLRDVPANVQIEELTRMSFSVGTIQVQACRAQHPGMCVGYRLSAAGGSMAFFPDNELRHASPSGAAHQATGSTNSTKSGLCEFLRGTDVLIMDTQYTCEEYALHAGWGHGCLDEVVALALEAKVKRLFLFHHDPDHSDAMIAEMLEHARNLVPAGKSLEIDAAREGLSFGVGG
ncbi:MAG TPA: MBL fold metallo-hydrolase, partial [Verrucomicrobiae bacterium]|nr:MBL fold metallo-hydrolase [Verrucomicrobiae bacterium]